MYAENFYIALYDRERDSLRFLYFADVVDDQVLLAGPRDPAGADRTRPDLVPHPRQASADGLHDAT